MRGNREKTGGVGVSVAVLWAVMIAFCLATGVAAPVFFPGGGSSPGGVSPVDGAEAEFSGMLAYMPRSGELPGWNLSGRPQFAAGDDLFLLINGGAEIYHEFGFKRLILGSYRDSGAGGFNLEIYEMEDSAAAYGVYTFKTGESGRSLDIGDDAVLEDYYLNIRKGRFVVTVTGMNSREETLAVVEAAGRRVSQRLPSGGERPALIAFVPEAGEWSGGRKAVKYLEGPLGLYALLPGGGELFAVKEAAAGIYEKCRFFIFRYDSPAEALERSRAVMASFKSVPVRLEQQGRYVFFVDGVPGPGWRQAATLKIPEPDQPGGGK